MASSSNRKYKETIRVLTARNRFWQKLKGVQAAASSYTQDDNFDDLFNENQISYGSGRGSRKAELNSFTESPSAVVKKPFVVKFFERPVNLVQFDETTPMYPMCRSWMKSDVNTVAPVNELDQSEMADSEEEVGVLPPPFPVDEKDNPRIPVFQPPSLKSDIAWEINSVGHMAPSPAVLFQEHLQRWISVRGRWKEAARYNAERYAQSFEILERMYCKD